MLYEGGIQDRNKGGKLGKAMEKFHEKNVQGLQKGTGGGEGGTTRSS